MYDDQCLLKVVWEKNNLKMAALEDLEASSRKKNINRRSQKETGQEVWECDEVCG